jgi:hypothetical protein
MSIPSAATRLWWVHLPRGAARISGHLGRSLLDGIWLGVWRVLASVATPAAFAAGMWIGWRHPGFENQPSESLALLIVLAALGMASAHLGIAFLAGFVLGDFFLAHTVWSFSSRIVESRDWWGGPIGAHLLRVRVPLLISYGVWAALLVTVPLGVKAVARPLLPDDRAPLVLRVAIAAVAEVALAAVAVYLWSLASPVLLRPVFTWVGQAPDVAAIRPLQEDAVTIARVAALVALLRLGAQVLTVTAPRLGERAGELERELREPIGARPLYERLPIFVRACVVAALTTLLLAGMFGVLLDAGLVFVAVLVFQLIRTGVIPLPIAPWARLVERIPVLIRFGTGVAVMYLAGQWFLPDRVRAAATFRPQLVFLLLGLAVFFVLIPTVPARRRDAVEAVGS